MDEKSHEPLLSTLSLIVETAVKLRKDGHKVIIVSSGAIGVGLQRMDMEKRPKKLSKLQVRPSRTSARDEKGRPNLRVLGTGSNRAMPVNESMGWPLHSPSTTYCPDSPDQERHCRRE